MQDVAPNDSRAPVWPLVVVAAMYGLWILFLGVLAVLNRAG